MDTLAPICYNGCIITKEQGKRKMKGIVITGLITTLCWIVFKISFIRDRSRYRNCYFLFIALISVIPFILEVSGPYARAAAAATADLTLLGLLVVPFFLIFNGILMIRREGRRLAHQLSLALGAAILLGEVAFIATVIAYYNTYGIVTDQVFYRTPKFIVGALVSVTVIYGSMAFLIFMIYTLFLQIIPLKKDFDYVIVHGAGLLHGEEVSGLLKDRLDKAIEVYRKDPTPPKLIPAGGRGADELISEAEAMRRYLTAHGIPEGDVILEDASKTTYENLKFSKRILDGIEGRKYTALVTSNYHVYRALRYCRRIGLECTGIGSHTALYYWPSALIREFIAIHAEKKHAVTFAVGWLLCVAGVLYGIFR